MRFASRAAIFNFSASPLSSDFSSGINKAGAINLCLPRPTARVVVNIDVQDVVFGVGHLITYKRG